MSARDRRRAALAMRQGLPEVLFTSRMRDRLTELVDIDLDAVWDGSDGSVPDVEVLISGWGAPPLEPEVLNRMPHLEAVLHTGGSVKAFAEQTLWERGIRVTTSADANAIPVAQFATAVIVLALKGAVHVAPVYAAVPDETTTSGVYGSIVGIIGASRTGRATAQLLRQFGCHVLVSDPYLSETDATRLGVERVSLPLLFERSDVVSINAPALPSTYGLVDASLLSRMKDGATLVNTARPALIDDAALLRELRSGRIQAVLDVTDPEPLPAGHELLRMPNVLVTPHLAGAHGRELELLGESVVDELERFLADDPPRSPVRQAEIALRA